LPNKVDYYATTLIIITPLGKISLFATLNTTGLIAVMLSAAFFIVMLSVLASWLRFMFESVKFSLK